jgi:RNA polymerase sigma-70 factor (TIGR02957 family)
MIREGSPAVTVSRQWVDEFEAERRRLFGLAYRLLGSASEAEDVVQDAFLRWNATDRGSIVVPAAWLTRAVTNLCLNRLASASRRREEYVGLWLPEPVLTEDGSLGPLETLEQRDSISIALLLLLERLTPAERAVFVLREAFGYDHREIAEILELSEANCRQLHRRARQHVGEPRRRFTTSRERWSGLVGRFLAAAAAGDLESLEKLLAEDVTAWADGGGRVTAARRPIRGRDRVGRFVAGLTRKFGGEVVLGVADVNGEPALLAWTGEALTAVILADFVDDRLGSVRSVLNPDKLGFAERQASRLSRSPGPSGHSL